MTTPNTRTLDLDAVRRAFQERMKTMHTAPPDVHVPSFRNGQSLPGHPTRDPQSLGLLAGK